MSVIITVLLDTVPVSAIGIVVPVRGTFRNPEDNYLAVLIERTFKKIVDTLEVVHLNIVRVSGV